MSAKDKYMSQIGLCIFNNKIKLDTVIAPDIILPIQFHLILKILLLFFEMLNIIKVYVYYIFRLMEY